jgi:hypothetical protein
MNFFTKLKDKVGRRAWQNQTLIATAKLTENLFNEKENQYACTQWFQRHGQPVKQEFKEQIIETVLAIVESENPLIEFRRALIDKTRATITNSLLFTDEFDAERQYLLQEWNKRMKLDTDNEKLEIMAYQLFMFSQAESFVLRYLQPDFFERVDQENDWYLNYCKLVEEHFKTLYQSLIKIKYNSAEAIDALILKAYADSLEQYEKQLLDIS